MHRQHLVRARAGVLLDGVEAQRVTWLIDTTGVLAAAETYLLVTRMTGWDLDGYQDWLAATLTRLSAAPGG